MNPIRSDDHLPQPIQRQVDQDAIDNGIRSAPQPYRLIFTILRETGMRVGEVLDLRVGDGFWKPIEASDALSGLHKHLEVFTQLT